MSKKDEKILEQSYTIEALKDEVEYWENLAGTLTDDVRAKQDRIVELINENDRLTMTYEPYRPPGDEHEDLDFYGLIEMNSDLEEEIRILRREIQSLTTALCCTKPVPVPVAPKKPFIKNDRWWNFSFELWPGSWGLNYYRYDWQRAQRNGHPGTSREGSLQFGPFGFSWNRDPKS